MFSMSLTIPDIQLYNNFVSPLHCQDLVKLGFSLKTMHAWKKYYEGYILLTEAFDPDGYYSTSYAAVTNINGVPLIPAFTIKDCENELPDYILSRNLHTYYIKLKQFDTVPPVEDVRLPDALAILLKGSITLGVIDIIKKYANHE